MNLPSADVIKKTSLAPPPLAAWLPGPGKDFAPAAPNALVRLIVRSKFQYLKSL